MAAECFIYVIGSQCGPNKIGISANLHHRMRGIQSGNDRALSLIYQRPVPNERAAKIERRAHWLMQDARLHGEWFNVTSAVAMAAVDQAVDDGGEGEIARSGAGRPPIGGKQTLIRLTEEQRSRIDAIAGPNRMAQFIREAVETELLRREREKPKS